ncbi:MAG: histone deacetylase [Bryobacterales bacterium]
MSVRLGLLLDKVYKEHDTGPGHPERPERYDAVTAALERSGLLHHVERLKPRKAEVDEIALCHNRDYIALVEREVEAGRHELSTGDATICPRSYEVALAAVGGVLEAVDGVCKGELDRAFCAVRPPGHHARPNQGMGFCLFNNIALAARYAQSKHGLERVLIADWDVHHGNGTQDVFYEDGSVFFFSTHQAPWYPGTGKEWERGEGKGRDTTLNCPFPAGSGREEILGAFRHKLLPAARVFRPDLVLISAGFDSRKGDPLGQFLLTDDDFREMSEILLELASVTAGGRLISLLEGGYSLHGLAAGVQAHVEALET